MTGFVVRRLLALVPLMVIVSFLVFSLVALIPGDPARTLAGGVDPPEDVVAEIREQLRLDDPFVVQYGAWLAGVIRGDLGESLRDGRPVADEVRHRFPVTASVVVGALVVALLIGVPLGILAGSRPGSIADRLATGASSLGIAMPEFWLALLLVMVFAVNGVQAGPVEIRLPSSGYERFGDSPTGWARHLLLPWFAIGFGNAAAIARHLRGSLIDTLDQDYVRTARAKGLGTRAVVLKHGLKNAAMPVATVLGIQVAYALGGTVVIERIFALPGMGSYALQATLNRDLPVIQGVVLLAAVIFVVANLLIDLVYAYLNPKVRFS